MGDEKAVMPGSSVARIEIKDGCWGAEGRYFDVTVVLATPTVDPASDAVAHFGADDAKGWQ